MSRVYRFHGPADLLDQTKKELLRKRKKGIRRPLYLIAADACTITDKAGTRPIEEYQSAPRFQAVTLTRRESDLIALSNPGALPPAAMEDLHPWLPEQRYLNDSASSYQLLKTINRQFGRHFVYASDYCDEKWGTICNSLRQKSVLDSRFYTAWHLPIQDVHVLEENRPERSVVSIDFNGMYPACMQQLFPKPSGLRLVRLDRELGESEVLTSGLYRCVIENPLTEFITHHNPFRSFYLGRHLRARLDEPVEVDLNEFEVEFFKRHFRRIYLVDAVISDKVVRHPLAKEVQRSFAKRYNYRNQGNKALADREKYLATLMTSCAHRPARPNRVFKKRTHAMEALRIAYGIAPPNDEPEVATDIWIHGRKGIQLTLKDGLAIMQGPDIVNGSACFLLGQRIVARGRIVLLEMMERILKSAPGVEICYTNIDSIHFSLPTQHLDQVIDWLGSECSDALGSFKIEAVTRHGLWLEPGRYWLYSNDIEKFRNRSVGDQLRPFKDHSTQVVSRQLGELHVPIKTSIRMERTMSPTRSLSTDPDEELIRQLLIEVGNSTTCQEVWDAMERNHRVATPIRMGAFVELREKLSTSRSAASEREDDAQLM
ncbi:hypothetical protein [Aquabacterium sp.]|uniref:hypothetical protein n=1 Tax=Aquabacterium sp. TaxID=1872578 RepID=UPI002615CAE8|nr:hypothetical protein [Aquabacterium sp.]MDD2976105.1 hypothetical protein [Aquabacterium sp.]